MSFICLTDVILFSLMKTLFFLFALSHAVHSIASTIECRYGTLNEKPVVSIWAKRLIKSDGGFETLMGESERIDYVSFESYSSRDAAFRRCKVTQNDWSIEACRKKSDPKHFYDCAYNKNIGVLSEEELLGNTYNGELKTLAKTALLSVSVEVLKRCSCGIHR